MSMKQAREGYLLPHFGVIKGHGDGLKVRIVLDASAGFQGTTLNDYIFSGPKMSNDVDEVLLGFRLGAVALTADVKEMFLRIRLQISLKPKGTPVLIVSLCLNCLILIPLCFALITRPENMVDVYGVNTPARGILLCVYLSIAALSLVLLAMLGSGYTAQAQSWAIPLLALQVTYKLLTVPTIGLANPVAVTNLFVAAVHIGTVTVLFRQMAW